MQNDIAERANRIVAEINRKCDDNHDNPWRQDRWQAHENGVYRDKKPRTACNHLIVPIGTYLNIDTGDTKYEVAYTNNHSRRWRSIMVDASTLLTASKVTSLTDKGIVITSNLSKAFVDYMESVINEVDIPLYDSVSTVGWTEGNEQFVPYADDIVFDSASENAQTYKSFEQVGDLKEWAERLRPIRNRALPIRLAMGASFAAPLVSLTGQNSFIFNMRGISESGKTVTMMLAASIWGNPNQGKLVKSMDMTRNSMLAYSAFLKNLPFFGDELQTIKKKYGVGYDDIIMSLTEGIERGRLGSNSRMNNMRSWSTSFLFCGEDSLTQSFSGGGAKNRVIDCELTEKLFPDRNEGNEISNFVRENHGGAGRAYIEHLLERLKLNPSYVKDIYKRYFSMVMEQTDTTDKQAGAMALILTGDLIANEVFWKDRPLTAQEVHPYVLSAEDVSVANRSYRYLVSRIAANTQRFGILKGQEVEYPNGEVWGKREDNLVLMNKAIAEKVLAEGNFDFEAVKQEWSRRGYLQASNRHLVTKRKIYNATVECIAIVTDPEQPEQEGGSKDAKTKGN